MNLTHPYVVERLLNPALESVGLNERQPLLVYNPSPTIDSIVEHLLKIEANDDEERTHLRAIAVLALELVKLNGKEGDHTREIAGTADRLASDLHREEREGSGESIRALAIARRVRSALQTLKAHEDGDRAKARDYLRAAWAVGDLFRQVPADLIFTSQLEHELGAGQYRRLRELYEQRTEVAL